jgi:hypothetical protein
MKLKLSLAFVSSACVVIAVMAFPSAVLAQTSGDLSWLEDIGIQMTLDELIRTLLNTAISLAAVVAVFFLIFNGYKYMVSSGDTGKTEEAQKGIGNAVIGLVICLSAALIVNFVLDKLGIGISSLTSFLSIGIV